MFMFIFIFIPSLLYAMQEQSNNKQPAIFYQGDIPCVRCLEVFDEDEEASDKTIETEYKIKNEEIFDHYFCNSKETEHYDDILKIALLRKSLFVQLCVEASKVTNDRCCFDELVYKIKNNDFIETAMKGYVQIAITKKDLCHRLLRFIPTGHTHSKINDKKVTLVLNEYATEQDKIENEKIKANEALLAPIPLKWNEGYTPISYYFKHSGAQLLANYHFETDTTHHQHVVAEYNKLIQ